MQTYGCSRFAAKSKLHAALTDYISQRRAETLEGQDNNSDKDSN